MMGGVSSAGASASVSGTWAFTGATTKKVVAANKTIVFRM
jgi:hypothetical protein